jgi:restriction endonuclease S subunit
LQLRLLSQDFVQFTATLDTGDRPRVSWDQISKFEVLLPPLPEQHKIVEILEDHLSRLDAALADVKQVRVKAAQFRLSLLQAAFTGNLGSGGTGLMTTGEKKKLGGLAEVLRGTTITRKQVTAGEIPVIAGGKTPSCFHNVSNRIGQTITVSASGAYAGYIQYFNCSRI